MIADSVVQEFLRYKEKKPNFGPLNTVLIRGDLSTKEIRYAEVYAKRIRDNTAAFLAYKLYLMGDRERRALFERLKD